MFADAFTQALIYGVQTGVTYILIALGLTMIFGIMRLINTAHGEFYMLGAFFVYYLCTMFHINYFVSLIIAVILVALIGLLLERILFRPVQDRGMVITIIILTGVMVTLEGAAQLLFGTQSRGLPVPISGSISFLSVNLSMSRIVTLAIGLVLVAAVYWFVYRTTTGKAIQATANDREAASMQGINVNRITSIGVAVSLALAAAAGGLIAPIFYIDATMGSSILFKCLCIVILGGIGSVPGAALGGLILGVVESFGSRFLGYASATFPFLIIIIILLVRRQGLLGKEE